MAILDELVTQIENPDLRARIAAEVEKLAKQKKFGLVFEEHLPECTPLWDIPIKKGGKVALKTGQVSDFYTVLKIEDANKLNKLIAEVQTATSSLAEEDQQTVSECLEVIETEAVAEKPKKGMIKTALSALQTVKGVAEFGAAVATLVEFISPLL